MRSGRDLARRCRRKVGDDGKLVGTTVARYATRGPDTLRNLRFESTRAP